MRTFKTLLSTAALTTALTTGASLYHDIKAHEQSKTHVGMGIYFDPQVILQKIPEDIELRIYSNERTPQDEIKIAEYFSAQLTGSYDPQARAPKIFPPAMNASSYLDANNTSRGVCRQKAAVLAAILNHLGIEALVKTDLPLTTEWHAWVYLPKHQWKIDPTHNQSYKLAQIPSESSFLAYRMNAWFGGVVR